MYEIQVFFYQPSGSASALGFYLAANAEVLSI